MSSAQVDHPTKVGHVNKKENDKSQRKIFNQSHKKHNKHDESRHFKFGRKRLQSFTGNGKFFPPYKRRKKEGAIIPPTKFLLGGNICDPLNLNSMQDEEINRAMNAVTPKSSPLPTPKHRKETIEVIIPPNICDPLNLSNCNDNDEYEKQLISPTKKGAKKRNRKRKRASSGSGKEDVNQSGSETDKGIDSKSSGDDKNNQSITDDNKDAVKDHHDAKEPQETVANSNQSISSSSALVVSASQAVTTISPPLVTTVVAKESTEAIISSTASATTPITTAITELTPIKEIISNEITIISTTLSSCLTSTTSTTPTTSAISSPPSSNVIPTITTTAPPIILPIATAQQPTPKETKSESPQKDKNKLRLKGLDEIKDKRLRKVDVKDKIVSPVIPQPGAWKPRLPHRPNQDKKKKSLALLPLPNFRSKNSRYQYGNYDRYYGYRNPHHNIDPRLTVFAQRKELFFDKDVLDIGCNIGHITLSVARDLAAHSVTGIDIDRKLIGIARRNIKHYVNCVRSPASNEDAANAGNSSTADCDTSFFPMSMPINYGPIDVPGFTKKNDHKGFPYNVTFVQGNYVLEDDSLLTSEQPQFDTILCLSITKWIHLNFGDAGLKQAFKRMHAQLRPGGVLVLESQSWSSYGRKKSLTERIYRNYHSIEFFPEKFTQYLLSSEVGFTKCEVVSIPPNPSRGFQRPIQLFTKAGTSPVLPTITRFVARAKEKKDSELRAFENDLFPCEIRNKHGNLSDLSQRSSESLSQYDQLENVYAPSTTPCYDTPSHNNDSQPAFETEKMCYVDVGTKNDSISLLNDVDNSASTTSTTNFDHKRKIESAIIIADDTKKPRLTDDSCIHYEQQQQVNQVGSTPNMKNENADKDADSLIGESQSTDLNEPAVDNT